MTPPPGELDRKYVHSSNEHYGDTVTILGWENPNHVVAASSTSGLSWKIPGRVGDSPIIGAGIYADDEIGCAGATGWGEELWKAVASFRVVEAMRHGKSPAEACSEVVEQMVRRQPEFLPNAVRGFCAQQQGGVRGGQYARRIPDVDLQGRHDGNGGCRWGFGLGVAKLIGTAGHVDHGKTALIRALTGIDADRLPEEKKRGMTIDVGFAYIDFPTLGRVSIVDVPGHERFSGTCWLVRWAWMLRCSASRPTRESSPRLVSIFRFWSCCQFSK